MSDDVISGLQHGSAHQIGIIIVVYHDDVIVRHVI